MCNQCSTYTNGLAVYRAQDPTRTTLLRKAFVRDMDKRFAALKRVIIQTVDTNDAFGLRSSAIVVQNAAPQNAFAFSRSQDKVTAFMDWLDRQVKAGLLEMHQAQQLGTAVEQAWTNQYIADSYKRGVMRARAEMRRAGYTVPALTEAEAGIVLSGPFHADRVGVLYTRTFTDLKGITDLMDSQMSRVLAQGMIDGDGPATIARKLTKVLDGLGDLEITDTLGRVIPAKRRAQILARTEIIRAHHTAMVQEYMNWRVAGVTVQAEFITAGDSRVCEQCAGMQGNVYTLEQAMGLIPVHPQCRCIVLPIRANETVLIN